jgi:hypothetical protein
MFSLRRRDQDISNNPCHCHSDLQSAVKDKKEQLVTIRMKAREKIYIIVFLPE